MQQAKMNATNKTNHMTNLGIRGRLLERRSWGVTIKYAAIDAFATYESWRIIYDVIIGLDRAKREKEAKKKNKAVIPYSN